MGGDFQLGHNEECVSGNFAAVPFEQDVESEAGFHFLKLTPDPSRLQGSISFVANQVYLRWR